MEKDHNSKGNEKLNPVEKKDIVRLDALIRLISDLLVVQYNVKKNMIYKSLNETGLSPTEIGTIFGRSRTDIGSELSKLKKTKKTKGKE